MNLDKEISNIIDKSIDTTTTTTTIVSKYYGILPNTPTNFIIDILSKIELLDGEDDEIPTIGFINNDIYLEMTFTDFKNSLNLTIKFHIIFWSILKNEYYMNENEIMILLLEVSNTYLCDYNYFDKIELLDK